MTHAAREKARAMHIEGAPWCIVCAEREANASGMPHLMYAITRLVRVRAEDLCPECNLAYGRKAALDAADRITVVLS